MAKKIDGAKVRRRKEALREVRHMQANADSTKDMKAMKKRPAGRTVDGVSRPSTNKYRQRWNEIFGKKESDELDESYKQSLKNKKERIFGKKKL